MINESKSVDLLTYFLDLNDLNVPFLQLRMNDEAYQVAVAAVALIVGLCLTWDGPQMWQAIFTLALSCLAALAACFEAQAWQLSFFSIATVMCQARPFLFIFFIIFNTRNNK